MIYADFCSLGLPFAAMKTTICMHNNSIVDPYSTRNHAWIISTMLA